MLLPPLRSGRLIGAACALLLAASGSAVLAQTAGGRSIGVATPAAGNAAAATANALPSPGGLSSPLISPGGLTTQPPAGLSATPSGSSGTGRPLPTNGGSGIVNGGLDNSGGYAPATNVLGGPGGSGGLGNGAYSNTIFPAHGPYATVDVARSFLGADADRNGELTRSEAQRLLIHPFSFEEMDRNGNGVVTRWEYEDALR